MSSMEAIVRPFQTPNVTPSTPFFTPGKAGVPNVILQCGRNGGGKMFSGSFSLSESFYCTQYTNEKKQADFGTPSGG
jgi:hypothetical protein